MPGSPTKPRSSASPFAGPKQRYLSRYTHRVAISNRRLMAADDAGVAFRWKDYRIDGPGRWKTMRLRPHEFMRRSHARAAQGLPPHPRLRPLRQRQPRREHRNSPRTTRRRPACRRPSTAAGCHTGRAACAAQPMPALRRPHDRHRGLRSRLRAKVAADPNRERHIMSQTACEHRRFPVPLHWLHAGGDPSRQNHANQPVDRPLIPFIAPPRSPLRASRTPSALHPGRLAPVSRPPS